MPDTICWAAIAAAALLPGCGVRPAAEPDSAPVASAHGGVEMVALPGGWFEMGAADAAEPDQPRHKVYVSPLSMDKYPVTQEEYEKRMGRNPSHWRSPGNPVEQIRWREAADYCNARSHAEGLQPAYDLRTGQCNFDADGYRLPTEAEYEYALRAGATTAYFFGDSAADLPRYAWFKPNSPRGPHPVGQKPPNAWGLCDMIGGVWEWCNDYYAEDYYRRSPERDPRGPAGGQNRVVRGGCWNSKPDDLCSSYRNYEMPAYTDICFAKDIHGQIGFRCVRSRPH
ncbi:MAG: formylglycine-generating enzyme family protein [Thermoguttaceae bacterium]